MTKNINDLDAGLEALELPSKTASSRKDDARNHFRQRVINEGASPNTAIAESLVLALRKDKRDRDKRLKAGKQAAGITLMSRVKATASDVRSRLPKRKPKQTHEDTSSHEQHWSHNDTKLSAVYALICLIGVLVFLFFQPLVFNAYNAKYGVGYGTGMSLALFLGLTLIAYFVITAFRNQMRRDHPRPDPLLSSDEDLRAAGIK